MNSNITSLASPTYERVSNLIREEIINNTFPPGSRLKLAELSKRYGVSQVPIREALQQLRGEGLLIMEPNKGTTVRSVDELFVQNMYDIRGAVEMLLVKLSIDKLTEADIHTLEVLQKEFESLAEKEDIEACLEVNKQLHYNIYKAADNPIAIRIISQHWALIDGLRGKYSFGPERFSEINEEHNKLIDLLKKGESAKAQNMIKKHCENAKNDLLARM